MRKLRKNTEEIERKKLKKSMKLQFKQYLLPFLLTLLTLLLPSMFRLWTYPGMWILSWSAFPRVCAHPQVLF